VDCASLAAAPLHQAERVRASLEPYRASMLRRIDVNVIRVTPFTRGW
jgi:hypothetical protein